MKLAYWMYAGPAHIGTLRVASSFKNVHAIMHAPLGDDYFNVLRSMLERARDFTPVTASIVDRHVLARGSQDKVIENITRKDREESPDLILLTPTCTSSILQEDLQNFVNRASSDASCDVILADVNHYRINELQAADRTLEQVVRFYTSNKDTQAQCREKTKMPSANILGIFTLGFHNQHDCRELKRLLNDLGVRIHQTIPEGTRVNQLSELTRAWFNVVPYREVGLMAARYLEKNFGMPYVAVTPMGIINTARFIREIHKAKALTRLRVESFNSTEIKVPEEPQGLDTYVDEQTRFVSQAAWFSKSIDCQNLTGRRAFVFGDGTHAASMTKILACELGIRVVCAGTYCKHDGDWFREQVQGFCDQVLITDDHTQVSDMIAKLEPSAIFGTQMERHVGKRLDIPCGVISAPVHIQNFPLSYRPFLGYEGTNQIADLVYNSFNLGMEDHLLEIFGGHDNANGSEANSQGQGSPQLFEPIAQKCLIDWAPEALRELEKIPGFVRGRVKRNTEKFALKQQAQLITIEVMYAAKETLSN
uniref:Light-independent protochlorophyllide reductase subunit B n=1 Tax=Pseudobryopsis hainanensis TaxID=2320808 RepID=A0A3S7SXM4_9CHLO|nr:Protochlorophyllide reductase subunit B [Pseudobryopsis hainanensis]